MSADMTSRMSDLSNMMNPEQADTQAQVVTSIAPAPAAAPAAGGPVRLDACTARRCVVCC